MRLFAFGDSFTFGLTKENGDRQRCHTFIEQIGQDLGYEVRNRARSGCCNAEITSMVSIGMMEFMPEDFVFVGWSGLSRPFTWREGKDWSGYTNAAPDEALDEQSIEERVFKSAMCMRYVSDLLTKKKVKHLMISAFVDHKTLDFDLGSSESWPNWIEYDKYNNTLIDICIDKWLDPTPEEFGWWRNHTDDSIPITDYLASCKHPNQEGHDLIAKTLKPYFVEAMNA